MIEQRLGALTTLNSRADIEPTEIMQRELFLFMTRLINPLAFDASHNLNDNLHRFIQKSDFKLPDRLQLPILLLSFL